MKNILVAGDFVLDHHIYEGRRFDYADRVDEGVRLKRELGGAALVHEILTKLVEPPWTSHLAIHNPISPDGTNQLTPSDDGSMQAYAFWRPFPPDVHRSDVPREKHVWRVSEAMGFGFAEPTTPQNRWKPAERLPRSFDIVALSEGGMGFRESPDDWPEDQLAAAQWIVLKTTAPVATGRLWHRLASSYADKLVVIVLASELRKAPARVSAGLSWEKSLQDALREVGSGGAFHALTQCRHLIVAFDIEGAMWLDLPKRKGDGPRLGPDSTVQVLYDASTIEGDHAQSIPGMAYGFSSCLAAAVTWTLSLDLEKPDFVGAMDAGLSAMRDLREKGHGPANETPRGFPAERLATAIRQKPYLYSRATFPAGAPAASANWSLLRHSQVRQGPVYDLARLVLLRGGIALSNVPHLRIGDYMTPDWHEIESLRSLTQIIRRYQHHDAGKKPLSIGVFGPPGAGKSFAVKQLAKHLVGKTWLEFNLSQFNTPADLTGAFHQIRDWVLQGQLPVAFFDEFDSQNYRWLKHLLAPMQDGHFQEGQLTHAVGKCIMVFAGGTSWTFETLGPPESSGGTRADQESVDQFRLAKGPDFKSRLDGYLNVVGPNARQVAIQAGTNPSPGAEWFAGRWFATDADDIHFPLRRALMIRAELRCGRDEKLDIDEGLVYALLRIPRYTHGARSLGKVLQPMTAARPRPLRRSLLLPSAQLDMHVTAADFLQLCTEAPAVPYPPGDPLTEDQITVMAPAIHATYLRQSGVSVDANQEFSKLSAFHQASNRAAAGRMLEILNLVGLRLEKGKATPEEDARLRAQLEYSLETLAEAEHEGWMAWHVAQGWRYAPETVKANQLHQCLLPYRQLPRIEADKDRATIRMYPDYARTAGMKIVFA